MNWKPFHFVRVKGLPVLTVEDKLEAPSLVPVQVLLVLLQRINCNSEGIQILTVGDILEAPLLCASEGASSCYRSR